MSDTYTTISGDTWDGIAFKTLKNAMHTDKLIRANLEHRNIYIFPAGIVLTVPTIKENAPNGLPPWKKGIV